VRVMAPPIEDSFPLEVLERIVGLLDNNGLASLARVNQKFQIIAEPELYKVLLLDTSPTGPFDTMLANYYSATGLSSNCQDPRNGRNSSIFFQRKSYLSGAWLDIQPGRTPLYTS
jgi:hypothetical protein